MAMLSIDRPEQMVEDGVFTEDAEICLRQARLHGAGAGSAFGCSGRSRPICSGPISTFVTQLIATAEHDPQTRALRRATLADAQNAYRRHTVGAGVRTRQII